MKVAVTGDVAALDEAIEAFRAAVADDPDDALARAHLGEAMVWQVGEVPMSKKRAQGQAGFAEQDAAVAMAPHDPAVRLVRARNGYILPMAFGRNEIVTKDFVWLVTQAETEGAHLHGDLARQIFYHAGAFALKERRGREAASLFEQAMKSPGKEPTDEQLQSMLALAQGQFTPLGHGNAEAQDSPAPSRP